MHLEQLKSIKCEIKLQLSGPLVFRVLVSVILVNYLALILQNVHNSFSNHCACLLKSELMGDLDYIDMKFM